MMGWRADQYVGASLFDAVVPEDLGHAATLLGEGSLYYGSVLGPMRMRFVDGSGRETFAIDPACRSRKPSDSPTPRSAR